MYEALDLKALFLLYPKANSLPSPTAICFLECSESNAQLVQLACSICFKAFIFIMLVTKKISYILVVIFY